MFEHLKYGGEAFTIDELVSKIKGEEEKPTLLLDYLEEQRAKIAQQVGVDITPATNKKYKCITSHVQHFLQIAFKVKNYPLYGSQYCSAPSCWRRRG